MKGYAKEKSYRIERCGVSEVNDMCFAYHPYKSGPGKCARCYAAKEGDKTVAVFAFKPPAYGAAAKYGEGNPHSVTTLSRMAALPREERINKHVSKMMKSAILAMFDACPEYDKCLTFSDSSCGHTGYVYECAGFEKVSVTGQEYFLDAAGNRTSKNTSGKRNTGAFFAGYCILTGWLYRRKNK